MKLWLCKFNYKIKVAFTLVEVLIVITVIGVVAAITIPSLVTKINDKIKDTRITTINSKLKQGTDKLMVMDHINGYETTEDFVIALSEHMKISSWCSAAKITECFPYTKINVDGGDEYVNVADLKTPETFGLSSTEYSAPVSFITGDGIPYIIMYKKDCTIDEGDIRTNSSACIAGIYDWNGTKAPNKIVSKTSPETGFALTDIQFLGDITRLKDIVTGQIDGYLSPAIGKYKTFKVLSHNFNEPINTCGQTGKGMEGDNQTYCTRNCWYGAVKACEKYNMELPELSVLNKIYNQRSGNSILNSKAYGNYYMSNTFVNNRLLNVKNLTNGSVGSYYVNYCNWSFGLLCVGE